MDGLDEFLQTRPPTANRPLLGLTVLVVEDSRFACEALRLLCLRSGARIRRADSLAHAARHLAVYRPSVVIVDMGLPDGPGAGLIADLARAQPRIGVILGTSGDPDMADAALAAGADGFLAKPLETLAGFQQAILRHLPADRQPRGPRLAETERVEPDPIALRDDLAHAADVLRAGSGPDPLPGSRAAGGDGLEYVTQFLASVALSARDTALQDAVGALAARRRSGGSAAPEVARLTALVADRIGPGARMI